MLISFCVFVSLNVSMDFLPVIQELFLPDTVNLTILSNMNAAVILCSAKSFSTVFNAR